MPIRAFIPAGVTFNPAEMDAMNQALESGWRVLKHAGYKVGQEALAAKIVLAAADGERDPIRLRDIALAQLGVHT